MDIVTFVKHYVLPFAPVLYGAALIGTHVFGAQTRAYKLCQWVVSGAAALGKSPQPAPQPPAA